MFFSAPVRLLCVVTLVLICISDSARALEWPRLEQCNVVLSTSSSPYTDYRVRVATALAGAGKRFQEMPLDVSLLKGLQDNYQDLIAGKWENQMPTLPDPELRGFRDGTVFSFFRTGVNGNRSMMRTFVHIDTRFSTMQEVYRFYLLNYIKESADLAEGDTRKNFLERAIPVLEEFVNTKVAMTSFHATPGIVQSTSHVFEMRSLIEGKFPVQMEILPTDQSFNEYLVFVVEQAQAAEEVFKSEWLNRVRDHFLISSHDAGTGNTFRGPHLKLVCKNAASISECLNLMDELTR